MATADVSGPLYDLEDIARALGVNPRSVHQAIARRRLPRPHTRGARGALAWTEQEAGDIVAHRILDTAFPARDALLGRLEESELLVAQEYARRLALLVLGVLRRR